MTNDEKKTNKLLARRRYAELRTKKQKGAFLDQFCAMTGMHRKSALRSLSRKARRRRKRGRPFGTDMEVRALLFKIWKLAQRPCAKLLRPILPAWVASLRRAGEELDEETVCGLLGLSARTIDRRLGTVRPRPDGRRRAASLAEHRRQIPLKVQSWPADAASHPGWEEADSVELCGGSTAGRYNCVVVLTDVATQWTEMAVSPTKRPEAVAQCLRENARRLPFAVMGVNSDNGPDYINEVLNRCFTEIFPGAQRTRSRPYHKNDNAHVEQKNGHRARRLFGFGRYDEPGATQAMDELARLQSLFDNLYRPTMKLLRKRQDGHKWRKVFEKEPRTPAQRIVQDPATPAWSRRRVERLLQENDPLELLRKIEAAKDRLRRVLARLAQKAPAPGVPENRSMFR